MLDIIFIEYSQHEIPNSNQYFQTAPRCFSAGRFFLLSRCGERARLAVGLVKKRKNTFVMEIELLEITIGDVANGYTDNAEEGVTGYGGKLNIRPPYQREFVYKEEQERAVIHTIMRGFPLNTMYWVKNADGTFELLDGQQRTISFCQYVNGGFSINDKQNGRDVLIFDNLTPTEKERFLSYKLFVYVCEGNDKERLDWFRTINIAGERLTEQELRNAN